MEIQSQISRKAFIQRLLLLGGGVMASGTALSQIRIRKPSPRINFGLTTKFWGRDWDIQNIIANLTAAQVTGVELWTGQAHGIVSELDKSERREIRRMFRGSAVEVIGIATEQQFDYPDRSLLREAIEKTIAYIQLSRDIGGSGVVVRPNQLHAGVPKSRTVEQIGRALHQLAVVGSDNGQQIRLEMMGHETQDVDIIKDIMDVAGHPNATVCWTSSRRDLEGRGLKGNFNLLKDRLGAVVRTGKLNDPDYPYRELIDLLVAENYRGYLVMEGRTDCTQDIEALSRQQKLFEQMIDQLGN
jgi:sugar phosphate isomerase/epimerase